MDTTSQSVLKSWREEKESAFLYRYMVLAEKGTPREKLFNDLAYAAEEQAEIWAQKLSKMGVSLPQYYPNVRARIVAWMISHLGPRAMKPILAAMKVRGLSVYLDKMPGSSAATIEMEPQHRIIQKGVAVRASVFGINDGLVSNASLILGVAGASSNPSIIVLTGIAGMCAGALSMAAGEYISMQSQRELFEYQIGLERAELEEYPEQEAAELSIIYQARGLSKNDADDFAKKILSNKEQGLKTLAREELGLNPDELGSPWVAAFSSFITFALGGFIPLVPFFFKSGNVGLSISIALTGLSLFLVGLALSLFTGQNAIYSGLRMLFIGLFAGATTYAIGKIVGINL